MKALDIALKDLTQSFRNLSVLAFIFLVPVLVTGMFYLMFGGLGGDDDEGFALPRTEVQIVNLDAGGLPADAGFLASVPQGSDLRGIHSMGEVLAQFLQGEGFAEVMAVTAAPDAASARTAVDSQEAAVAIVIPQNFTAALIDPTERAVVELYQDPTLTLGPSVVKGIVSQFVDGFSGSKVAIGANVEQLNDAGLAMDAAQLQVLVAQYLASAAGQGRQQIGGESRLLAVVSPTGEGDASPLVGAVGLIMAGMTIFYGFFTGPSSVQSILSEDEKGTLARLFTTPTPQSTILGGKFLATALTVLIQFIALLVFGSLVFGIEWGNPIAVGLVTLGIVAASPAFGIFLMSLIKRARQAGVVLGGVVTLTGILGLASIFAANRSPAAKLVSLFVPQGWALRGLELAMNGGGAGDVLPAVVALLAWSAVFFVIGVTRCRKRFA